MMLNPYHRPLTAWYRAHARDLPWRHPGCPPWGVLVCEVMSQQTPVARVEPYWRAWLERWPEPANLATAPPADAVRAWGRLGYPRRALRLREAAIVITDQYGGSVPACEGDLLSLPGVGAYTAAAVRAFAFGKRSVVVDTNVRRVLARVVRGAEVADSAGEDAVAANLVPVSAPAAARWNAAVMELGALVCTARNPACGSCPLRGQCRWLADGRPTHDGPVRRRQPWHGTDRQVRGRIMALLREHIEPVPLPAIEAVWGETEQGRRCLQTLLDDGLAQLVEEAPVPRYALPTL